MTPRTVARDFRRVHRGVYADPAVALGPTETIRAAWLRAGPHAVVGGVSAAVLHGSTFFDHGDHVELLRHPTGQGRRSRDIQIVRAVVDPADIAVVDGMPVTSPIRTAFDLGRRRPSWLALAHLDDITAAGELDTRELWRFIVAHPALRGIRQIRGLVPWIDPSAESSGESWMRHLILADGLPRPETQVKVYDGHGVVVARFDVAYRAERVGIEFDGFEFHYGDAQRDADATRDRETARLGWQTVRRNSQQLSRDPIGFLVVLRQLLSERSRRRSA